jgi:hypothetical protein
MRRYRRYWPAAVDGDGGCLDDEVHVRSAERPVARTRTWSPCGSMLVMVAGREFGAQLAGTIREPLSTLSLRSHLGGGLRIDWEHDSYRWTAPHKAKRFANRVDWLDNVLAATGHYPAAVPNPNQGSAP